VLSRFPVHHAQNYDISTDGRESSLSGRS
jgi:hypothetical protein